MGNGTPLTTSDGVRRLVGENLALLSPGPSPLMPGFSREMFMDNFLSGAARYALNDDADVDRWITARRASAQLRAEVVPLDRLGEWRVEEATGNIIHRTGRFFTISGVRARHRTRHGDLEWDQPIIDQREIGLLGILAKRFNGVLHFCLQAKEEPGNLHAVQLSPTVQATYSNYTRVHGGTLPPFVELFLDPPRERVLYAKLQTEDGGRFLFKSNRNMIVLVGEDDARALPDGFLWLTVRQVRALLRRDNLVNACARSVLSSLVWFMDALFAPLKNGLSADDLGGPAARAVLERILDEHDCASCRGDIPGIIQWLDDMKARNHMFQKRVGINTLADWGMDRNGHLSHKRGKFFKIVGLRITSGSREVAAWTQPILDNVATGIIGLLVKKIGATDHYLMQAKAEVGNRNIVQIAPTVQFTQENYTGNEGLTKPFLFDEFNQPDKFALLEESRQSEEGARFFQEQHIHRILRMPEDMPLEIPPEFRWFSRREIGYFLHFGEQVNSCARSILATLV